MTAALPNRPDRPRRPVGTPWVKAVADSGAEPGTAVAEPGLAEQLACVRAVRELLAGIDGHGADATDPLRIDLLTATEELKGAIAAAQARVTVAFTESQQATGQAAGRGAREVDRGIGPQLALARRCSASTADRQRSLAAALTTVLPHTLAALTAGTIGEAHAQAMQAATTGLSAEVRMVIDSRLAGRLPILTPKQLGAAATHLAAELDVEALVAKHRLAVTGRGAWTRPAPDGMAYLTVLGPLPEIVGAVAALHAHATAVTAGHAPDDPAQDRTHAQVMADTALTRLSGRAIGQAQPVAVTLVMTPDNLYGHHTNPHLAADHTDAEVGAGAGTVGDTDHAGDAKAVGSGRRLTVVGDPSAENGTAAEGLSDVCTTDDGTPEDYATDRSTETNSPAGATAARGTDRAYPGAANSDPDTAVPDTAEGDGAATAAGAGAANGKKEPDDSDKTHRPGTRARCAPSATPARIVGHGSIAAPLARAWLLHGCDSPDNDIGSDEHPDQPPPDHTDLPHPDPLSSPSTESGRAAPPGQKARDDSPPNSSAGPHPAEVWLRRAFTSADGRDLIALESTARLFPPQLRALLVLRDDKCRIPFCDAPIRHADHITPVVAGGPTTLANGQGLSARCNYTKDLAGFSTRILTAAELATLAAGPDTDRNAIIARQAGPDSHVTAVTTPTGHTYLSCNPPALGWAVGT